jgi:flagellar motor switch protein FliM
VSGEVLSPGAIAALVDAAREGRLPEAAPTPQRRRRMRAVDFTRPTKFNSDQERRLKRAMEAFCRTASQRMSAELRVPLELEMINATQLTWANAHAQIPADSIAALVQVQPIDTRMMLSAEQGLLLGAIELLLGSPDTSRAKPRRLTDIDWALGRHFLDRLLAQLSVIWTDVADLELQLQGLDMHLETAQMAPVSEPTLAMTMEARLEGTSSTVALLLPWTAIAPVADRFASRDDMMGSQRPEDAQSVRRAVSRVEMTVRAEVAAIEMPIEEVLALREGDVLRLNAPAEAGVTLYADRVPVQQGKPGRSGSRRAVQITGRVGGES